MISFFTERRCPSRSIPLCTGTSYFDEISEMTQLGEEATRSNTLTQAELIFPSDDCFLGVNTTEFRAVS